MAEVSTVRARGQITIPASIRKQVGVDEGSIVEFSVTEEGVLMRPKLMIDPDQAWFWAPEWQAKEREADAEVAAGGGEIYETAEEFQAALDRAWKEARREATS